MEQGLSLKFWLVLIFNLAIAVQGSTRSGDMVIAIAGPDHPLPSYSPVPIDVTITNSSNQDLQI
jgi:hypothetical protein